MQIFQKEEHKTQMDGDSSTDSDERNDKNGLIYKACLHRNTRDGYAFLCFKRFLS